MNSIFPSPPRYVLQTRFGTSSPVTPQQPEALTPRRDPQPRKKANLGQIAMLSIGLFGISSGAYRLGPSVVKELKGYFDSGKAAITQTFSPSVKGNETQKTEQANSVEKKSDVDDIGTLESILWTYLLAHSFLAVKSTRKGPFSRKTIRPSELFSELHQRGITGKGLKAAVIDTGYRPVSRLPQERVTFFQVDALNKPSKPVDVLGHGTAVATIIAEALPDTQIVSIGIDNIAAVKNKRKQVREQHFQNWLKAPDGMTLEQVRKLWGGEIIEDFSKAVEKAVAEDVQVINMSLGESNCISKQFDREIKSAETSLKVYKRLYKWGGRFIPAKRERYQQQIKEMETYLKKLRKLSHDEQLTPYNPDADWLQPWKIALDKAQSKGIPVVMSSGNDGTDYAQKLAFGEDYDFLVDINHPALILVASTDEAGNASTFNTEYEKEGVNPFISANGDGELETQAAFLTNRSLLGLLIFVFGPSLSINDYLEYKNPSGTSFAAPDFSSIYLLMKSVDPKMTPDKAKAIMQKMAQPVSFSKGVKEAIEMSVKTTHPLTEKLVDELREKVEKALPGKVLCVKDSENTTADPQAKKPYGNMKLFHTNWIFQEKLNDEDLKTMKMLLGEFINIWSDKKTWEPVQTELDAEVIKASGRYVGSGTIAGIRNAIVEEAERLAREDNLFVNR